MDGLIAWARFFFNIKNQNNESRKHLLNFLKQFLLRRKFLFLKNNGTSLNNKQLLDEAEQNIV